MSADSTRTSDDPAAAQQRFLCLFLRSEREVLRYVAALVPNVIDAEVREVYAEGKPEA